MKSCIHCVEKHLGRAAGYYEEARAGYPGRMGRVLGEMSLAEEEARESYAAVAAQIRGQRKVLEAVDRSGPLPSMPFDSLLKTVEGALRTARPEERKTAPGDCVGCGPAKKIGPRPQGALGVRSLRNALQHRRKPAPELAEAPAEADQDPTITPYQGPMASVRAIPYNKPQVLILMTAFSDFAPSYSLVSVVLDQARAGVLAGYRVVITGMSNLARPTELIDSDPLLRQVEFVGLVPVVHWKEDQSPDEDVETVTNAVVPFLREFTNPIIITHDLIFQTWYLAWAKALHTSINELIGPTWYHQMHSSVGARPPEEVAQWRAVIPEGHGLVVPNFSDVEHMRSYYQHEGEVVVLPNIRDFRTFLGLSPRARYIADTYAPHLADVVQVYPVSMPRAQAKGLDKVIKTFAAIKALGRSVCLIAAEAHATGDGAKGSRAMIEEARAAGLEVGKEYLATSQIFPKRAAVGMAAEDVRGLMQMANVFLFPSVSEACGLVMLEAASTGALLCLNQSVHQLQDFIPPEGALWVDWGGARQEGDPREEHVAQTVAQAVVRELEGSRAQVARKRSLVRWSLEGLAQRLRGLAGPGA